MFIIRRIRHIGLLAMLLILCVFSDFARNNIGYTINTNYPTFDSISAVNRIPVLCYHQVRDWTGADSKNDRTYIVPIASFRAQIKLLHDSGYNAILPDQLVAYLEKGEKLPEHPFMLTFDDGTESQFTNAMPELDKAGFKAVFFIMTVVLGHSPFMNKDNVSAIAQKGHVIGCHTWDHRNVRQFKDNDWTKQVEKPKSELEKISGSPVKYFAYPYGIWDTAAIARLRKYGFIAAFQLWGKIDNAIPLFTLRRILVSGYWKPEDFMSAIHKAKKQLTQNKP